MKYKMAGFNISNKIKVLKNFTRILLVMVLFILSVEVFAQSNKKQDKLFNEAKQELSLENYSKAIELCNRMIKDDPQFKDAHLMLADIYNDLDSTNLEIIHLNKAGEIGREWLVVFRLGEAYYKKGEYSEALHYYNIYSDYMAIPEKRRFLLACKIASCKFAIHSIENAVEFSPQNLGDNINTTDDEYWPTPSLDGQTLVFTRLLKNDDKRPQEDFFMAELDSSKWDIAKPMNEVNTIDNEGAQTLSADSKILFFTACNRPDGLGSCDIYYSKFENGKWSTPVNAGGPLNSSAWEAQPSFSSDSRYLYFSSNRGGGKGNKDIWRAELEGFSENGLPKWKAPENLGEIINTVGNEISPFIHANNRNFYFASDTHVGMGGLDLFTAEIDEFGSIENFKNLGYPINTHKDEMGLTISSIGDTAYFSSARNAENGLDIFSFNLERGLRPTPVSYVKALVRDKSTQLPILASIDLIDLSSYNKKSQLKIADEKGEVMLCLPLRRNYSFNVSEPGYLFYSQSILLKDETTIVDPYNLDIELEPIEVGAKMELYNIYYEVDSFAILTQSEPELQKLVSFLTNNGDLKIEIQGHTDSSGNADTNKKLSEMRAKSVVVYLVENGIEISRLEYGGYGDTVPIATNETVEGRRQNRRTTIKIIEK